jgi:hypothetical protein
VRAGRRYGHGFRFAPEPDYGLLYAVSNLPPSRSTLRAAAITRSDSSRARAPERCRSRAPPPGEETADNTQARDEQTALVDAAIHSGPWTDDDVTKFRAILPRLSAADRPTALTEVSQTIDEHRFEVEATESPPRRPGEAYSAHGSPCAAPPSVVLAWGLR